MPPIFLSSFSMRQLWLRKSIRFGLNDTMSRLENKLPSESGGTIKRMEMEEYSSERKRELQEILCHQLGWTPDAFDDDYYIGMTPPTLSEWISDTVYGSPPDEVDSQWCRSYGYRMFKTKNDDYSLQQTFGSLTNCNVATGSFEFIVEEHKKYTRDIPPAFIGQESTAVV